MTIRRLRSEDFEERMALSQFAFQLRFSEIEMDNRRKKWKPDHNWGYFDEDGRLLSAVTVLPFETWAQGRKIGMGGLAGVATWPDARRQGCVRQLIVHSLEQMKTDGQMVSMLNPFSFAFYRKYGWEMTVERKQYTLELYHLPKRTEAAGQVKRIAAPDLSPLNTIYEAYASRYSGMLVRTEEWWADKWLTKQGTWAVYENESGTPEGYLYYEVLNSKLTVLDWAFTTEASRIALWSYIGNHDSMIREATITVPIDDPLTFLLADPRIKQEIIPYFMSRIVDAETFVLQYAWAPGAAGEAVTLRLSDPYASWNEGTFKLSWDAEGNGRLDRAETGGSADTGPVIATDIQGLTALLLGNRKATFLLQVGRIEADAEAVEMIERRIPARTTHLSDFF